MVPFYLISGLGGQLGTYNATMFAFTADTCEGGACRAWYFSLVESCIFAGACVGPLIGGWLYDAEGASLVFAMSVASYAAAAMYLVIVFPAHRP